MEMTLGTLDSVSGAFIVDMELPGAADLESDLSSVLGSSESMGCAKPTEKFMPDADGSTVGARITGVWHNSLVEGPGRRSVVQFQGCPIRCKGCWVPETWNANGGELRSIDTIADALLDPDYDRDGVTIIGGEPFAQTDALANLVGELRYRQPGIHITVYSGYTLQELILQCTRAGFLGIDTASVLSTIDVLIDGPYIKAEADKAGPWTGSGNQRVHLLR